MNDADAAQQNSLPQHLQEYEDLEERVRALEEALHAAEEALRRVRASAVMTSEAHDIADAYFAAVQPGGNTEGEA